MVCGVLHLTGNEMDNQKIRIRRKAFDHRLLDKSSGQIADTAKPTGAVV